MATCLEEVMAPAAVPDARSSKPGRKRLLITIITLLSFIIGTPFWYKSTQVYRAPLRLEDIASYSRWASSSSLRLRCQLHVIFTSEVESSVTEGQVHSLASKIQGQIHSFNEQTLSDKQSCQAGFEPPVTWDAPNFCLRSRKEDGILVWPCGLGSPTLLKTLQLSNDDAVDEILWKFSKRHVVSESGNSSYSADDGGLYTVVVLQTESGKGSSNFWMVLGKYRHAWISGEFSSSGALENDVAVRIGDLAVNFFGGAKIGSVERKGTSMFLSADGEAILSFSLLNVDPSDWIFDWDFEDLERRFLRPVVDSLKGSARLKVESQVQYYKPKAVKSYWVPTLNSHIVPAKQLPFFVSGTRIA